MASTPRTFRVSGKLSIHELNAATGLAIPDESFDTVGGWVLDLFGRVPHRGEKKETEDGIRVSVEKVERTRVVEVLVALPDVGGPPEADVIYVWLIGLCPARDRALLGGRDVVHRGQPAAPAPPGGGGHRTAARYLESFKQPGAPPVHRDDGRDDRPHHRLVSVATWALIPVVGAGAAAPGRPSPSPRSCSYSARSSRRRWRGSGRPGSS